MTTKIIFSEHFGFSKSRENIKRQPKFLIRIPIGHTGVGLGAIPSTK